MHLWLVHVDHMRYRGGWTDHFLMSADTQEQAIAKCTPKDDHVAVYAEELDTEKLGRTPYMLGDTGAYYNTWRFDWVEEEE